MIAFHAPTFVFHLFMGLASLLDEIPGKGFQIPALNTFLNNIGGFLIGLGVAICAIGLIVGGLMRAAAFGNERRISASNLALSCAVIGLVIVLFAYTVGNALNNTIPH